MHRFGLMISLVLLVTACGPAPLPPSTPNLQATTGAIAATMVADSLTSQPSPTFAPSVTPIPSATHTDLPTVAPTSPAIETQTVTPESVFTLTPDLSQTIGPSPTAWEGTLSLGNTDGLPTGLLRIENNTGVKEITVTLTGITAIRELPIYMAYTVTGALNLTIFYGKYEYIVQIPNKRIMKGTFSQNNKDKTLMRIDLAKVVIIGP